MSVIINNYKYNTFEDLLDNSCLTEKEKAEIDEQTRLTGLKIKAREEKKNFKNLNNSLKNPSSKTNAVQNNTTKKESVNYVRR